VRRIECGLLCALVRLFRSARLDSTEREEGKHSSSSSRREARRTATQEERHSLPTHEDNECAPSHLLASHRLRRGGGLTHPVWLVCCARTVSTAVPINCPNVRPLTNRQTHGNAADTSS
jgi:hypothetical protein